ncbi:MAG: carbon starvation CstA family protein [Synergistaceae bacterium]|nr:carbon starvation CstA family protein [Synergistaceae bacterium]
MFAVMLIAALVMLVLGYKFYGDFMAGVYGLDNGKKTPAETLNDGMDYCPAHPAVLLGHHFSSIAGAGPIVGPIQAAAVFGWLPAFVWCMVGSIFLGGPHDMGAVVASMRNDGKSVGVVIEKYIGKTGEKLFLWFTILSLVLVVAVFLVMTTSTFVADPVVAFVGCLYIFLAIISGILIYRFNVDLKLVTIVMLAIIAVCSWKGGDWAFVQTVFGHDANFWNAALAIYILAASILPVWLLLQPRDYLASFFLYFAVIVGAIGMLFGSSMNMGNVPMIASNIKLLGVSKAPSWPLWPMLFTVVACGAISGFHSLVGSGTTSKQLSHERDALPIGYGGMLLEGLVAVIALGTFMAAGAMQKGGPTATFGLGFGKFCGLIGIDPVIGMRLGMIAVNGFLLTSLDTATRLARYQIQEISNNKIDKYTATIVAIAAALVFVYFKTTDATGKAVAAWAVIWPVFGASNQLVAALALLGIAAWIIRGLKKKATFLLIPFWFMLVTSMAGLVIEIVTTMSSGAPNYPLAVISGILLVLAVLLVKEGMKAIKQN